MDFNQWNEDDMKKQMEEMQRIFQERNPEIDMENRTKNAWLALLPFTLVFALQFALLFMGFEFLFTWLAVHFDGGTYGDFVKQTYEILSGPTFNLVISALYASICAVAYTVWYRRKILPRRPKRASVWKKNPPLLAVGLLCFGVGAQYASTYLANALALLFPDWLLMYRQLMEGIGLGDGGGVTALTILYAVILGPVAEELTFRGLTLGYGRRAMPFWRANVVQALLFAMLHMNPIQSIYTFVLGLLFGYIAWRSDSLVLAIAAHMILNAMGVFGARLIVMGRNPISFFALLLMGLLLTYAGLECINRCSYEKGE